MLVCPMVLNRFDFWFCAAAHGALVALQRFDMLQLPDDTAVGDVSGVAVLVPVELAVPMLALALLLVSLYAFEKYRQHEEATKEIALVGEEVCVFVQELQATFGRVEAALPLRFAAAKYALASVYVFFFVITMGSVPPHGWAEMQAKGLLDEAEAHFMESKYSGDRMALLHVWAMWAAHEAHLVARDGRGGKAFPACYAGGADRMAQALRAAQVSARRFAGRIATPAPFHMAQLRETLVLLVLLLWAAVAAPLARSSYYVASGAYVVLLVALLGLQEAATWLEDPLCEDGACSFPVTDAVNATADVVAQLLVTSLDGSSSPCNTWRELGHALFTQGQVERRTPSAAFPQQGTGPRRWPARRSQQFGEKMPAPLVDVGCCYLDERRLGMRCGGWSSGRPAAQRSAAEHLERLWLARDASDEAPSPGLPVAAADAVVHKTIQPAPFQQSLLGFEAYVGPLAPRPSGTVKPSDAVSAECSLVGSVPGAAPYVGAGGVSKKAARNNRRVGDVGSAGAAGCGSSISAPGTGCAGGLPKKAEPRVFGSREGPASCWAGPTE